MFQKVLVANRGEIALRILRACREMGLPTVAVFSEADRDAGYVAHADEAVEIGPAPARESYLRIDRILEAARETKADAIHPGYGFLAENPRFAKACVKAGVTFIGPPARALAALGDKIAARRAANSLGIATIPGITGRVDERSVRAFGKKHGYPVLLKAAAGGGGRGMRVVHRATEIAGCIREASAEAEGAFGDSTLFVERYLEHARHVEIQVVADRRGRTVHLGERDCSIQRRHQKLVEESPSPAVDEDLRKRMGEAACRLLSKARYENAGTCEFLLDEDGSFFFLEVNARLQVEHPVTEMITGIDLVQLQIHLAAGGDLPFEQEDVVSWGHAIELRICAEDPARGFAPAAGEVVDVRFPAGPGVRVDSDLRPGSTVTIHYDSLVAKLICWAENRTAALARADRAVREFAVAGIPTTLPFHRQILSDPRFISGDIHTRYLEKEFTPGTPDKEACRVAAILAAALEAAHREAVGPATPSRPLSAWQTASWEDE